MPKRDTQKCRQCGHYRHYGEFARLYHPGPTEGVYQEGYDAVCLECFEDATSAFNRDEQHRQRPAWTTRIWRWYNPALQEWVPLVPGSPVVRSQLPATVARQEKEHTTRIAREKRETMARNAARFEIAHFLGNFDADAVCSHYPEQDRDLLRAAIADITRSLRCRE